MTQFLVIHHTYKLRRFAWDILTEWLIFSLHLLCRTWPPSFWFTWVVMPTDKWVVVRISFSTRKMF